MVVGEGGLSECYEMVHGFRGHRMRGYITKGQVMRGKENRRCE